MEDNTESQTRPAAPVPKVVLPTGVKVTGWILLFVATWNLAWGYVGIWPHLLFPDDVPLTHLFEAARVLTNWTISLWAAVAFIGSIGLLLRKEWGRKATVFAVYYLIGWALAWAVFANIVPVPRHETSAEVAFRIIGIVISSAVMLAAIFGLYLLVRYLGKPKVRAAFRH